MNIKSAVLLLSLCASVWAQCTSTTINPFTGKRDCVGIGSSRTINTTSPLTGGGNLSADRTLACPTCTTSGAAMTANAIIKGAGLQSLVASGVTIDGSNNLSTPGTLTSGVGGASSGILTLSGATSGSASIGVASVAGTPATVLLPTATAAIANAVLGSNALNPQQASWITLPSIAGIATPAQLSQTVNAQTGTTYTFADTDRGRLVTFNNANPGSETLPQAGVGSNFVDGWFTDVQNTGTGTVTITPSVSTIDGAASLSLTTNQGVRIFSNGVDYKTQRGIGGSGLVTFKMDGTTVGTASQVEFITGAGLVWTRTFDGTIVHYTPVVDSATIATLTDTQTLTNKTLTTPKIASVKDANGNPFLDATSTASAVDGVTVTNAATANPATVKVAATGSDANVNLQLEAKGTGTLNLAGVNATVTAAGALSVTSCTGCGTGGGADLTTAGQGVWYPFTSGYPDHAGFTTAGAFNRLRQVTIPFGITARKIQFYVGTALGAACTGGTCGLKFALYDAACTTKLWETTAFTSAAATGIQTASVTTPAHIAAGVYNLLAATDSAAVTFSFSQANANVAMGFRNAAVTRDGTITGVTGNGAGLTLPATCGVVTADNTVGPFTIMVEP